jgi:pyruvate formate lyase activating enzyme
MRIKIGGYVETSLIDVIGHPSFVVFFSGCNFNCPWCHNREILTSGFDVDLNFLLRKIRSNFVVDFVQASGGEPTLQSRALKVFFEEVKSLNLKTSLNTNGSNPRVIESFLNKELVDHLAMDVKFPLNSNYDYEKIIGIRDSSVIKNLLKTLELISDHDFVELRTTLIPELSENDIFNICEHLNSISENFIYVLQQCVTDSYITPKKFVMELAKKVKRKFSFKEVYVRGREVGVVKI